MHEKFLFSKGFEVFSLEEYTVANPIAKRDYAETYRLSRKRDGRPFLMKVYIPAEMPVELKFNQEPRLLAYLNSSGISASLSTASWGEFHSDDGRMFPFVISDYFEHGLLSDRLLTGGAMDAPEAVGLCFDIVSSLLGMRTPKGGNFVHCDICPENIMFGRDENGDLRAHLIDNDHIRHIDAGDVPDNWWEDVDLRYTAPEAFTREEAFPNSDIYSLGVILHECYYGRYPWDFNADSYRKAGPGGKMGILMHARNADPVKATGGRNIREGDPHGPVVDELVKEFTIFDYDEYEETRELRPSLLSAWQMLLAAKTVMASPEKPGGTELQAYFNMVNSRYGDIFADAGAEAPTPSGESPSATENPGPAQEIAGSATDDSEFTNAELGYTPLVKMHDPAARGFRDVAGMDKLKEEMQKKLLYFLKNPSLAREYKIDLPNGMLLYGPPGCGKTFFAEKLAEESGFNYALVKASDLGSTWVHGGQGKIGMLFKEARAKSPCIICLDEFDAFAPRRETISNSSLSGEVNEFLSQLNNCGRDRIFVIATTNNPDIIDPAMLRSGRIDRCIFIPAPDAQARRAVFRLCVEKRPHDEDIDYKMLAARTEGYVTSDICGIVNDAAMNAAYARTGISQAMLLQAIDNWKPTVNRDQLARHEEIRRRMESDFATEIPIALNDKILN